MSILIVSAVAMAGIVIRPIYSPKPLCPAVLEHGRMFTNWPRAATPVSGRKPIQDRVQFQRQQECKSSGFMRKTGILRALPEKDSGLRKGRDCLRVVNCQITRNAVRFRVEANCPVGGTSGHIRLSALLFSSELVAICRHMEQINQKPGRTIALRGVRMDVCYQAVKKWK